MKNAKIFINNSIIDSEETFGVFFTDASITALMTPSPLNATLDKCSVLTRAKSKKTFPNHNPYTISRCKNCKLAKGIPDNDLCAACRIIHDYSSLRGNIKPPKVETYEQHYNGRVFSGPYHGSEELAENLEIAKKSG